MEELVGLLILIIVFGVPFYFAFRRKPSIEEMPEKYETE